MTGVTPVTGAPVETVAAGTPVTPAPPARRGGATAAAAALYLVLGLGLWWGVWSAHPSAVTTCGCGDAARFAWYFAWPAFALTHGHDVLFSTWLFHPTGINLLDDTSVVALGVVLAPVTWTAGPVAAMNVGLTAAPVLSALAMFVLVRRWVSWGPAAFVAGLVYGFSPFMVTELALNQLNIAFLPLLPLAVLVLADLVGEGRRRPAVDGLLLAGLAAVQFFVSTEVLLIGVLTMAGGLVALAAWARWRRPGLVRARAHRVVAGLAVAAAASAVLLAYPSWFLLAGPAHVSGPIWSGGATARYGTTLGNLVAPGHLTGLLPSMLAFGGYQGPSLVGLGYLGLGVLVVAVAGVVVWRRDRLLLLFAGVGLVAFVLSLAPGHGIPVPWDVLRHVPWVGDVVEGRFSIVVTGCAALVVGIVLDHIREATASGPASPTTPCPTTPSPTTPCPATPSPTARTTPPSRRWWGVGAWLTVAVVVVPTVVVLWPNLPLTVRTVVVPTWYERHGRTGPPDRVILAYPVPSSGLQSSQVWQALDDMAWMQASGGGPQGQPFRAGSARAGTAVLSAASLPLGPAPVPTPAAVAAVRSALAQWRVTTVVVPDEPGLPRYIEGRGSAYAVGFFTAVLGSAPTFGDGAWVWEHVDRRPPGTPVTAAAFARCTQDPALFAPSAPVAARSAVVGCVLAAAVPIGA